MTEREALNLALKNAEAIVSSNLPQDCPDCEATMVWVHSMAQSIVQSIKEALAQPEQEPVAVTAEMARAFHRAISDGPLGQADEFEIQTGLEAAFAHITTPPQRTWAGLTWEEIDECFKITPDQYLPAQIYKRIEAKLKEKNT